MKKALFVFLFLLISSNAWAVTYYAKNVTGNWSAASSWSATGSGGADSVGVPTTAIDVVFDSGFTGTLTVDTSGAAAKTVVANAGATGSLILAGTNRIACYGSFTMVAGMTFTPSSTNVNALSFFGSSTLTTGGKLLTNVSNLAGTLTLGDNLSFSASKTNVLTITSGATLDLNGKTLSGHSATNRILITSGTIGSAANITVSSGTFARADFRDITFSNGGNDLDLSAITDLSGDCGGNSNATGGKVVTFTTPTTQTYTDTGSNDSWSTVARWTNHVPLPQDTVVISGTATKNLTADMPRLGKNISFTTATNFVAGTTLTHFGNLNFTNAGTNTGVQFWNFESQARSGDVTITCAGKQFNGGVYVTMPGATLKPQDTFASATGGQFGLTIRAGTFNDNGKAVNWSGISFDNNTLVKAIVKTGNWSCNKNGTPGGVLDISYTTNSSWSDTAGTIYITDTGTGDKQIRGAGFTIGNIEVTGGGTGPITFTGSSSYGKFVVNGPKTVTITPGTSQAFTNFQPLGKNGSVVTLNTGGAAAGITQATGRIDGKYMAITNVTCTGGAACYAGWNSTVSGTTTGWKIENASGGLSVAGD